MLFSGSVELKVRERLLETEFFTWKTDEDGLCDW